MIEKLLKYIKEEQNQEFIDNFTQSVNSFHRVLLLETAISHDNIKLFSFLKNVTSLTEDDYVRISFSNIKNQKHFKEEYCFYHKLNNKTVSTLNSDNIKDICRLGSESSLAFMEAHPIYVHINFTWFIHYALIFKNEKFLENIFNSNLTEKQVLISCMSVIHHKENDFLPIILETAFENNIDINFKKDTYTTQKLMRNYLSNIINSKDGKSSVDIMNMLVEEQVKAFETILYDITKDITYNNNNNSFKF